MEPSSITKSERIKPEKITPKQEVEQKKRAQAKLQKQAEAESQAEAQKKLEAEKRVEAERKAKAKAKLKERMKAKEKVKEKTKARVAKKTTPAAITKPKPRSSSTSSDLSRGEKYFKEKRWDRAMKYFKKYLEQNPLDEEMKEKYTAAKKNTDQAISLYKQAKKNGERGRI